MAPPKNDERPKKIKKKPALPQKRTTQLK